MLSKDKNVGDITAATGIYFYLVLPFFLRTNILKSAVTSVLNRYTVALTKLMELAHSDTAMGSFKKEVMRCKYKGQVSFDQ